MKFEVIHAQWAVEGPPGDDGEPSSLVYAGGVHDDVKLTKQRAPVFAAAEAAGSIVILDATDAERALLDGHVQSQEDGEAAYAVAVESGDWHEGNLLQFELDVASGFRTDTLELTDDDVADAAVVLGEQS